MTFTFVDLCCGVGAFHIALKAVGGKCVLACDKDNRCKQVYLDNFGKNTPWIEDLKDIDVLPKHDVLCAGFPCQPFSLAGLQQGVNDERGKIVYMILGLLAHMKTKPKLVILENVSGIKTVSNGQVLRYILTKLNSLGYNVYINEYDARDFGSPISRKRVLIFGTLKVMFDPSTEPTGTVRRALEDILEKSKVYTWVKNERYVILPKAKWTHTVDDKIFVGYMKEKTYPKEDLTKISSHRQGFRIYHPGAGCETFTSDHKYYIYNPIVKKVRALTPREMYNCMGFPASFNIYSKPSVAARQISNSINLFMLKPLVKWAINNTFTK